ncbi:MAG: tRNA cytidylyltransferase [Planctomycetes bacterium]|nr:tRNA cytidylyltransferase [Planctomycetota bacterium]
MRRPSIAHVESHLASVVRTVALKLASAGQRAWVVGGSTRDLALGREPKDVDMTSAATPEEVEPLFAHVVPLGRAFGTLQLLVDGVTIEHTTFRTETDYSDSRRPTSVRFGRSLEEDAARRDFTCNALYLDPLTDELADPTGGLSDLERGILRTVGEPGARFREDGLRLVRMARFAAAFGLEIEPATWAAARASTAALVGVSVERALAEFERMFGAAGAARALALLDAAGLLEPLMPGQSALHPNVLAASEAQRLRLAALAALEPAVGVAVGFAVLLDPDPQGSDEATGTAEALLERLRPSRELRRAVAALWRVRRELESVLATPSVPRSRSIRLARDEAFEDGARIAAAFRHALGKDGAPIASLVQWKRGLRADELHPAPLLAPEDLTNAGVPRDARFGATLAALETEQLDGRLAAREDALAWLASRVRSL